MYKKGVTALSAFFAVLFIFLIAIGSVYFVSQRERVKLSPIGDATIDLGAELGLVDPEVMEFGSGKFEEDQLKNLLGGFIEEYSEIEDIESLYLVYGTYEKLTIMQYKNAGGSKLQLVKGKVESREYPADAEEDVIIIGSEEHKFSLEEGEIFYFMIMQTAAGKKGFQGGA
ncbi:MAG: hypothetical protein ABIB79_01180 [archaeon]